MTENTSVRAAHKFPLTTLRNRQLLFFISYKGFRSDIFAGVSHVYGYSKGGEIRSLVPKSAHSHDSYVMVLRELQTIQCLAEEQAEFFSGRLATSRVSFIRAVVDPPFF